MHASLEQLISLRDEEPVSVSVQEHVRGCGFCARTLNELAAVRDGLGQCADPLPPPGAWAEIVAKAEGRGARALRVRRWLPAAGVALVASVAGAILMLNTHQLLTVPEQQVVTPPASLGELMAQSRYLERAVLEVGNNADQMPVSAGTASTVASLEDRIALVDYEINDTSGPKPDDTRLAQLWRQRVDLLQSLAAVRYAQVTNSGI